MTRTYGYFVRQTASPIASISASGTRRTCSRKTAIADPADRARAAAPLSPDPLGAAARRPGRRPGRRAPRGASGCSSMASPSRRSSTGHIRVAAAEAALWRGDPDAALDVDPGRRCGRSATRELAALSPPPLPDRDACRRRPRRGRSGARDDAAAERAAIQAGTDLWESLQPVLDRLPVPASTDPRRRDGRGGRDGRGRASPPTTASRRPPPGWTPRIAGKIARTHTFAPIAAGGRPRRCSGTAIEPAAATALSEAARRRDELGARPLAMADRGARRQVASGPAATTRRRLRATTRSRRRSVRPDPARARRPAAARQGPDEPPDRRRALHQREHGRRPRVEHPRQARRVDTDGGCGHRGEARARHRLASRRAGERS